MKPNQNLEVLERPGRDREGLLGTLVEDGGFPALPHPVETIGIDSGATLVKLCVEAEGERFFATWPSPSTERLRAWLAEQAPAHLGLTGCGAAGLAEALGESATGPARPAQAERSARGPQPPRTAIEFEAWTHGANEMLARLGQPATAPYLLVSIGTGTSALHVEGERYTRVGGTALGGGAALGLGHALLGVRTSGELNALALRGRRESVDLLVSDLFGDAEGVVVIPRHVVDGLAREAHAGPDRAETERPTPADLAAATLGIVADNVALLTVAHARAVGVSRIVYGGSTFYSHPQIEHTVAGYAALSGFEVCVLPLAGHVGALGAMLLGRRD